MSHLSTTVRPLAAVPRLPRPLRLGVLLAALAVAIGVFASVLTGPASAATVNRQVVSRSTRFCTSTTTSPGRSPMSRRPST